MGFYPRKKAKKIYPSVKTFKDSEKPGLLGFVAYKAGMTHVVATDMNENSSSYGQKIAIPTTILDSPPIFVFGLRLYEKTPYGLKVIGDVYSDKPPKELSRILVLPKEFKTKEAIEEAHKHLNRAAEIRALVVTQPRKIRLKKTPEVLEVRIGGNVHDAWKFGTEILGKEVNASDIFSEGNVIDVIAVTKGKGTQGPVKRFGIKIQFRKAHGHLRMPGAIGAWHPARVLHTAPMKGQMGFQRRTELNKIILKIGQDGKEVTPDGGFVDYGELSDGYVMIKGSVPGPKKRLVFLRHGLRAKESKPVPAITYVSRVSQQ